MRKIIRHSIYIIVIYMIVGSVNALSVDLSEQEVFVDVGFHGKEIFVFGIAEKFSAVAVVIHGLPQSTRVYHKKKKYGIWVNSDPIVFENIPYFYYRSSSSNFWREAQNLDPLDASKYDIDLSLLTFKVGNITSELKREANTYFNALLDIKKRKNLYVINDSDVNIVDNTLFSTRIKLPDSLKSGDYKITILTLKDSKIISHEEQILKVSKDSVIMQLENLAYNHRYIYTFAIIVMSILSGWISHRVLRKIWG